MITKEITICNQPVTLGYCYATEIAYHDLADEDIHDFIQQVGSAVQNGRMPDAKKAILLIVACMMAYYEEADKAPVKDGDMMREATPIEIGTALGTILAMQAEFYHIPNGEPKDKSEKGGKKRKNA